MPYVLCNFYLSLYMKSLGVTDQEIGYLISLGFLSGAVTALAGGVVTDRLGRKRTTLIFDLIAWPGSYALYALSHSFSLFALSVVVNSFWRIATVGWNLMVIEDADDEQRVAAFNLLNIVTVATGVLTPLAGLLVRWLGIVAGERVLLVFAVASVFTQVVVRNHYYTETAAGQAILRRRAEARARGSGEVGGAFLLAPYREAFAALRQPEVARVACVVILYMVFLPVGSFTSLYFAPYLTETLGLGKAAISLLGGLHSGVVLLVLVFAVPVISRGDRLANMLVGLAFQVTALILLVVIPRGSFGLAALTVVLYAAGFAVFKPFMDASLAEATEGKSRAGIYALNNTLISLAGAGAAVFSGHLFHLFPGSVWLLAAAVLLACAGLVHGLRAGAAGRR